MAQMIIPWKIINVRLFREVILALILPGNSASSIKKVAQEVQGMPQPNAAAIPWHQEEMEKRSKSRLITKLIKLHVRPAKSLRCPHEESLGP